MRSGERQVAATLDGIRADHTARYRWAVEQIFAVKKNATVIDVACGIGYGSNILAEAGFRVTAIDRDAEAIAYGRAHYAHPNITFRVADADRLGRLPRADVAVCFETIEHIEDPSVLLRTLAGHTSVLLASVPNEKKFPWRRHKFHFRHYTRRQFVDLLGSCGFAAEEWWGQETSESEVAKSVNGRTLIVSAKRAAKATSVVSRAIKAPDGPKSVAILGLGTTLLEYVSFTTGMGARRKICDEVWGINSAIDVLNCDLGFHMDDIRVQERRAAADPTGNIAAMLPWLKNPSGPPILTSRAHPDYPRLIEYPLAAVLNGCNNQRYFNSTAAYAVAYAIFRGVKKIYCFGVDFSMAHSHRAERGRGNVEFWLGFAQARGIEIAMPQRTSLLDACEPPARRFYGYDTVRLEIEGHDGEEVVKQVPLDPSEWPTAEEIEDRYDHSRSTVPEHLRGA